MTWNSKQPSHIIVDGLQKPIAWLCLFVSMKNISNSELFVLYKDVIHVTSKKLIFILVVSSKVRNLV